MRFGRNSGARKARYRKRKTQKCHLRFCGTVNNEGHSFRKGAPFKWSKLKPICGISVVKREIAVVFTTAISIFGGLEGDRTLDLCDANAALSQSGKFSAHGLRYMVCRKCYQTMQVKMAEEQKDLSQKKKCGH